MMKQNSRGKDTSGLENNGTAVCFCYHRERDDYPLEKGHHCKDFCS